MRPARPSSIAAMALVLAGAASQALAYDGKATSYAGAGEAISGGGTGFNVSVMGATTARSPVNTHHPWRVSQQPLPRPPPPPLC